MSIPALTPSSPPSCTQHPPSCALPVSIPFSSSPHAQSQTSVISPSDAFPRSLPRSATSFPHHPSFAHPHPPHASKQLHQPAAIAPLLRHLHQSKFPLSPASPHSLCICKPQMRATTSCMPQMHPPKNSPLAYPPSFPAPPPSCATFAHSNILIPMPSSLLPSPRHLHAPDASKPVRAD